MSSGFTHSIRHKLFLTLDGDRLLYAIVSEHQEVLKTGEYAVTDASMLSDVLTNTLLFKEIYSTVVLIWSGVPFILHPSSFTSNRERRTLFQTSYTLKPTVQLKDVLISNEMGMSYRIDSELLKILKEKYNSLTYHCDGEIFLKYVSDVHKSNYHEIHVMPGNDNLLVLITKAGKLELLNRYDAKSTEDLFYFVMLAIEQLDIDIERGSLHVHGDSGSVDFASIERLFKPYIAEIKDSRKKNSIFEMAVQCA